MQREDERNFHSKDAQGEPQERTYIGQALQNGHKFNNKLVCIKYPGNVVNPEKAIETLGGTVVISEVRILVEFLSYKNILNKSDYIILKLYYSRL